MAPTKCKHCGEWMQTGDFGACMWVNDELFTGHYKCVVEALGPARFLAAAQKKMIPLIDPDSLVGHKLPEYSEESALHRAWTGNVPPTRLEWPESGVAISTDPALAVGVDGPPPDSATSHAQITQEEVSAP